MNKTTAWVFTSMGAIGFLFGTLMYNPIFSSARPGPEASCPVLFVQALIFVSLIIFSIGASFLKKIKNGTPTKGLDIYKIIIFGCIAYLVFLLLGLLVFTCRI